MGYTITSEDQIIDVTAIQNGCNKLVEVASQFKTHAETLRNIALQIDKNVLSADNQTVDDDIIAIADEVEALEGVVSDIATMIIITANSLFVQETGMYNDYLASLEENS